MANSGFPVFQIEGRYVPDAQNWDTSYTFVFDSPKELM